MNSLKVQNKCLNYFKKFIKKHFKSSKNIGVIHLNQIKVFFLIKMIIKHCIRHYKASF